LHALGRAGRSVRDVRAMRLMFSTEIHKEIEEVSVGVRPADANGAMIKVYDDRNLFARRDLCFATRRGAP
jgi:hypothetical protein